MAGPRPLAPRTGGSSARRVLLAPGPWVSALWPMLGLRAPARGRHQRQRRAPPARLLLEGPGGRVRAPRLRPRPGAGAEPAGRPPRPARPAALRRRRLDRPRRPLGHLLPNRPRGHASPAAASRSRSATPSLDPYGPTDNPAHAVEPGFREYFTSGLAHALARYRGRPNEWRLTAAGGIVSHTPDHYPICDRVAENVYAIVDSGHGFKMLALGGLAADDLLDGEPRLDPLPPRPVRARRDPRGVAESVSVDVAGRGPKS